MKGLDAQAVTVLKHDFHQKIRLGNFPIGLTALFSVVFLAVLFFLGVAIPMKP